ncbi:peptidoglycan recognition protein family protein [Clostridium perfringens]
MDIKKVYLKGQEEAKGWNKPNKIIIHHPEYKGSIEGLNDIMRSMGFYMIGYNFYVRKDGTVYEGRPVWATGANCYGHNHDSIGVCFEGNYDKETDMPPEQFDAGVELIKYLKNKYGINEVNGHKHYYNTACPGQYFPLEKMLSCLDGQLQQEVISNTPQVTNNNIDIKANAKVINDFLYARDSEGNKVGGYASIGDNIEVLDVSYSKQLDRIKYPTPNGAKERYVTNATNCIEYFYQDQWQNGSTPEPVYQDSDCSYPIGTLNPYEKATPIYRKDGVLHIVYSTDKGRNTKSGFVKYNGEFSIF